MRTETEEILDKFRELDGSARLLGLFLFIAGASKFVALGLWTGYEPRMVVEMLPLTADQLTLTGGAFETVLGIGLLVNRKTEIFAALSTIWLSAITVQMARIGLWDLVIRDLGLVFFSLVVLMQLNSEY